MTGIDAMGESLNDPDLIPVGWATVSTLGCGSRMRANPAEAPHALNLDVVGIGLPQHPGRVMYVNTGDPRGVALMQAGGDFNPKSLRLWRQLVSLHGWDVIVDVGANYGEMLLAVTIPGDSQILAFEPIPEVHALLTRSLQESGLSVALHRCALSDMPGELPFHVDANWSGTSSLLAGPASASDPSVQFVEVSTLDAQVLEPERRDVLLKIDVEGHERRVLGGGLKVFAAARRCVAMVEVLHMSQADRQWLLDRYAVYAWAPDTRHLVRCGGDAGHLTRMLESGLFYPQDVAVVLAGSLQ